MKKQTIRKSVSLLLLLTILLVNCGVFASSAYNPGEQIEPNYVHIASYRADLSISGATADCQAHLDAAHSTNLYIRMDLQKQKTNGYETVKTWSDSCTGTVLSMDKTRLINVLETYRLKVTFTAGNETVTVYRY